MLLGVSEESVVLWGVIGTSSVVDGGLEVRLVGSEVVSGRLTSCSSSSELEDGELDKVMLLLVLLAEFVKGFLVTSRFRFLCAAAKF